MDAIQMVFKNHEHMVMKFLQKGSLSVWSVIVFIFHGQTVIKPFVVKGILRKRTIDNWGPEIENAKTLGVQEPDFPKIAGKN